MTALCIAVGLMLLGCVVAVGIGCRAILDFCAQLESDRRVEYRIDQKASRTCPRWIANGRAVK